MRYLKTVFLAGLSTISFGTGAFAQTSGAQSESSSPPEEASGGDIVVTALRRAERLQDVPVSVTALGGDQLAEKRISGANDLVGVVPNLQAATTVGEGIPIFSLRGISMPDFSLNQQGPVATYFDEVYKGSFPLLPVAMFDLERVEVLRGPQGTLYGKNTTGGAINIISKKPGFDTEGYLRAGYGNYNRFDAEGAVQTALGSKAALRVAFTYARADGWLKNRFPGGSDANAVRQYGVRGTLLLQPTDNLELILRAATSLQNPTNYGIVARPGPDGIGAGVYEAFSQGTSYYRNGLGNREIESNFADQRRHRTYSASLTANLKLGDSLTVTSISSFDKGSLYIPDDADGSPRRVLEETLFARAKQFAQDLRITSDFDGGLNFIVGAYYNRETAFNSTVYKYFNDVDVDGNGVINADDCLVDFVTSCQYKNRFDQIRDGKAIYTDVNYKLSDVLTLRGGLRFTRDVGSLRNFNAQLIGADGVVIGNTIPGDPINPDATTSAGFKNSQVTGRAGVDIKLGRNLLYANYSRGYRASAFNALAFFAPSEVNVARPETVDSYEVGFKTQFLDRKITFNGAAFYYSYKNQQALNVDPTTVAQTLINLPKSRIYGAEFELTIRPSSDLTINSGLGLLSTKILNGNISGSSLVGNRLPNAPSVSLTGGFDWTAFRFAAGSIALRGDASYTSKQYFELFNTNRIAQRGYVVANGQIAFRSDNDRWGVSFWGRNIFNRYYLKSAIDVSGFGFDYTQIGDPRTYGATVDVKF